MARHLFIEYQVFYWNGHMKTECLKIEMAFLTVQVFFFLPHIPLFYTRGVPMSNMVFHCA